MGDILSYLDWRGDLTFSQSEFNEVDNLILAQMSYVELDGIIPTIESGRDISVEEANKLFFAHHTEQEVLEAKSFIHMAPFVLKKMAKAERFKDARLYNYVNIIDEITQIQFAAFHIKLSDGSIYVAFRGTDDTIVGWQEDFNLSFKTVPAQKAAVEYLEKTVKGRKKNYMVGGHSKGGNLAIYASSMCKKTVQNRIRTIYNNDGPGFSKEMLQTEGFLNMQPKVQSFSPEYSVIGRLLEHEGSYTIVDSSAKGMLQHDAMSWGVMGNRFVYKKSFAKQSDVLDETLKKWLKDMDAKQKEKFITNLFDVLHANGAETLTDISNGGLKQLGAIMMSFGDMDDATKEVITTLIRLMTTEYHKEFVQPILQKIIPMKKSDK